MSISMHILTDSLLSRQEWASGDWSLVARSLGEGGVGDEGTELGIRLDGVSDGAEFFLDLGEHLRRLPCIHSSCAWLHVNAASVHCIRILSSNIPIYCQLVNTGTLK